MTPDGSPVPHQTLHRSGRRIHRYYFRCACGFLRGRNARFPCSCGHPPPSWTAKQVREYEQFQRRVTRLMETT